jgi:predicted dehydrogenase
MIGVNHASAIAETDGIEVVAVVDELPDAAVRLADTIAAYAPRPRDYTSLSDALADPAVDLVIICTPSGLHVEQAEQAVGAGKHVVIEKPLDVDLSQARRSLETAALAESRGLVMSVISQHRFDPASVAVHDAIAGGELGRVTSGVASIAWWRGQQYYDSADWRGTWQLDGGGAAMNQGVHTIDLLLWFLGRPVSISAQTALLSHERIEVEDVAVATIEFESGALAVVHATTAAYPGLSTRVQVYGSRGSAIIQDDRLEYLHAAGAEDAAAGNQAGNQAAERVAAIDLTGGTADTGAFVHGHARQYHDLVDAIREARPPGVSVADALQVFAVVRGMYLSSTLGRTVQLSEVLDGSLDDVTVVTGGAK